MIECNINIKKELQNVDKCREIRFESEMNRMKKKQPKVTIIESEACSGLISLNFGLHSQRY